MHFAVLIQILIYIAAIISKIIFFNLLKIRYINYLKYKKIKH